MNINSKISVYNQLVQKLAKEPGIGNLKIERKNDYDFYCVLYGKINFSFNLREAVDILILKCEGTNPNMSDRELSGLGDILGKETKINSTAYENKLIMQSVVPLGNYSDDEAMEKINTKTFELINLIKNNQKEFEDFNDVEYETNVAEMEKNKTNLDEKNVEKNDTSSQPDTVTSYNHEYINEVTKEEQEHMETNEDTKIVIDKEEGKNEKEKNGNAVEETKDTTGKVINDNEEFVPDEVSDESLTSNNITNSEEKNNKNDSKKNNIPFFATKNKKETKDYLNKSKEKNESLIAQMKQMYDEMDRVFEKRKEILDYRENTLNAYATQLKDQKQDLDEKRNEIESSLTELQMEQENLKMKKKEMDMEKDNIAIQQKHLDEREALFGKDSITIESPKTSNEDFLEVLDGMGLEVYEKYDSGKKHYVTTKGNCQFEIYPEKNIIIAEKSVRKGFTYLKTVQTLNKENSDRVYYYTDRKVACHYVYDKIAVAVNEVYTNINNLV